MAHLTTSQACESFPPIQVNYTGKGHWLDESKGLGGCKTYASTPGESKKAIIYIYDIGGYCPQTYLGADILSSQGYHVYAPDIFKGGNIDFAKVQAMDPEEKAAAMGKFRSGFPGKLDTQLEPFKGMVQQLREMGYTKVGGAGFCWGGNLVASSPGVLDANAMIHPGAQTNAEQAEKLNTPTCLLPSQNEDHDTMEEFHKMMKTKPFGEQCVLKWYKDMPHGWCAARADLNSEKGKEKFQDAFEVLIKFFNDIL